MQFARLFNKHGIGPLLLACIPFMGLLWFVYLYGLTIPYSDQWYHFDFIEKALLGTVSPSDLWLTANEHHPIFLYIYLITIPPLTHWNHRIDLAVNPLLALGSFVWFLIFYKKIEKTFRLPAWSSWLTPVFISVSVFSLRQYEGWAWGVPMVWFLAVLLSLLGLGFLMEERFRWPRFVSAAVMGLAAVYSMTVGFAMWPAAFFLLLFQRYKSVRQKVYACLLWWLIFCVNAYVFFKDNFDIARHEPSVFAVMADKTTTLSYFFIFLGGIASYGYAFYFSLGGSLLFIVLVLNLSFLSPANKMNYTACLSIALFSLFCVLLCLIGRVGFGAGNAFVSRYSTVVYPFWVALFFLCLISYSEITQTRTGFFYQNKGGLQIFLIFCMIVLFLGIGRGSFMGIGKMRQYHDYIMEAEPELYHQQDEKLLSRLFDRPGKLRRDIQKLKKWKLSVFRE